MADLGRNEPPTGIWVRVGLLLARPYLRAMYLGAIEENKNAESRELERYWMGRMSTIHTALDGRFWSRWRMWRARF